jgi:hypothetical protein
VGSKIEYYRPRGIKGNYKVKIILELAETEGANIEYWDGGATIATYYTKAESAPNNMVLKHFVEENGALICTHEYPTIVGGKFLITISDRNVRIGNQIIAYEVTEDGIVEGPPNPNWFHEPFRLVTLNPIELIDLDAKQ